MHGIDGQLQEERVRVRVRLGRGGACDMDVLVSDVLDELEDEEQASEDRPADASAPLPR